MGFGLAFVAFVAFWLVAATFFNLLAAGACVSSVAEGGRELEAPARLAFVAAAFLAVSFLIAAFRKAIEYSKMVDGKQLVIELQLEHVDYNQSINELFPLPAWSARGSHMIAFMT